MTATRHPGVENPRIKRVYEPRTNEDGRRVLVDRIWPRGIGKDTLGDALWLKDIAPSTELRSWFDHRPENWNAFRTRYAQELKHNSEALEKLRRLCAEGPVTLLYSARDTEYNQAQALLEYLQKPG